MRVLSATTELLLSEEFAKKVLKLLMLVVLFLCLASFASHAVYHLFVDQNRSIEVFGQHLGDGIQLLDIDEEASIPAWFSTSLLLLCSVLLTVITLALRRASAPYLYHWTILSIAFVLLSLDESVALHERFILPLQTLLGTSGLLYLAWVIPGAAFVIVFFVAYLPFLYVLPVGFRKLFLLAGTFYVSGAIGMEMLGGRQLDLYGQENLTFATIVTAEEFLEMTGLILFLYGLIKYIQWLEIHLPSWLGTVSSVSDRRARTVESRSGAKRGVGP